MKKLLLVTTASLLVTNTAFAGNFETPASVDVAPVAAEATNWSGLYAGAVIGISLGTNYWAETSQNAESVPGNWEGTPIGFTVGYNHQLGNGLVIGGEGDYSAGDIIATSTSGIFNCGAGCETTLQGFATVRARVGYAAGKIMVFGTAGMAFAQATGAQSTFSDTPLGEGAVSGLVWGAGAEYAISPVWSVKAEYLSTDMGQLEIPTGCSVNCFTPINYQTVRVGVNYHF